MAGIYIHIPFCKQKCSYCDFHFSTSFGTYRQRMIDAICKEISERTCDIEKKIQSIYFGGGTPSILTSDELFQIMATLRSHFDLSDVKEITLEANPDDINSSNLSTWNKSGINRLSIGIQSFKESDLRWMNRAHSAEEGAKCIALARSHGFENITVDLMYGLPDLTLDEWKAHIEAVLEMKVEHISAYCLTVEPKTELHQMVDKGMIVPAGEDMQSEQFEILSNTLTAAGYDHYEISNFGKPGKYALHNSNYWRGKPYLGIGPSAHSYDGTTRRWNVANNAVYMKMEKTEWYEWEKLSPKDRWNELVLTGLRTSFGLDLNHLFEIMQPEEIFHKKVSEFIAAGWMNKHQDHLTLTLEGRLKADLLSSELFV